ncbi:hypothetical protein [Oceanobacillus bengalensis]|uniref:hypothetical protein n=1 Tax=Oceanobacillus bengalensis TaxID=1435466 RepID=UPI0015FFB081|nr:hypothetical protein [Oceanobacillus bengalensis]
MDQIIHQEQEIDFLPYVFITFISLVTIRKSAKVERVRKVLKKQLEQQYNNLGKV